MKIIEIKASDKEMLCDELKRANESIERAIFKLKESEKESDARMWEARGDYRYYPEDRRYRDDFRYRY